MKTRLVVATLGVLLPGLGLGGPGQAAELAGPAMRAALLGSWCNSDDGGKTCWAHDEFFADGRFRACGKTPDDAVPFSGEGRFEVSGQRMCDRIERATDSFWIRPGTRFCTDILAIDERQHSYRDIESGQRFVLHRRESAQPICPSP